MATIIMFSDMWLVTFIQDFYSLFTQTFHTSPCDGRGCQGLKWWAKLAVLGVLMGVFLWSSIFCLHIQRTVYPQQGHLRDGAGVCLWPAHGKVSLDIMVTTMHLLGKEERHALCPMSAGEQGLTNYSLVMDPYTGLVVLVMNQVMWRKMTFSNCLIRGISI